MLQRGMRVMRVIVLTVLSIGLVLTFTGGTFAGASRQHEQSGLCRPGWGYGDTNHCHTGPRASRQHEQSGLCRPGWGFGDTNHCHTGPPGHGHQGGGARRTTDPQADHGNNTGHGHRGGGPH